MNAMMRSRTGMALPMVLGAIVLIGTLVAGVMYLATQDYRVGANTLNETQAAATAEMGLNRLTTDWDLSRNTSMATGDTVRKLYTDPNGATANVLLTKLNGNFLCAVTAAGNIRVSGNVNVNGLDSVPSGWTGCGSTANVPGSVITPTATVT